MPIQFPSNPQTNQEYTYEGKVWAWDGVSWVGVRQETGVKKQNIWAKQNLLIPKRSTGLNSGYSGVTDQRRTQAGTIPALKHYIERDLGEFNSSGLWTPSLTTTFLWLDADDASTITLNGSNVSQWNDKSGNGRHATQPTAANQPTYTTNALNTKNAVTSAGAKSLVLSNQSVSNSTLFMVLNDTRNTGFAVAFVLTQSGAKVHNLLTHFSGISKWGSYTSTDRQANSDIDNNYAIASVENNSSNLVFHKNGTADGTVSNTGNAFTSSFIFNDQYGSSFAGNIAEIVFFDSTLTTDDRQRMEGYLAHKWGLTANLPVDHPYKNSAPTA